MAWMITIIFTIVVALDMFYGGQMLIDGGRRNVMNLAMFWLACALVIDAIRGAK